MFSQLLYKEFKLELRRKSVFSGLALYLFSTVFIYYISFNLHQSFFSPFMWSSLFWVTLLFTSVNTIAKSFIGERRGEQMYYYSIASPISIILSKITYNSLLCLVLALVGFLLFIIFFGSPIQDLPIFLMTTVLTCAGFASSLTLLSAIASKANNSSILMAVLSFPIIIGILLLAIRVTKNCIDGLDPSVSIDELLSLLAINLLVVAVSYLLFPYIWRS